MPPLPSQGRKLPKPVNPLEACLKCGTGYRMAGK